MLLCNTTILSMGLNVLSKCFQVPVPVVWKSLTASVNKNTLYFYYYYYYYYYVYVYFYYYYLCIYIYIYIYILPLRKPWPCDPLVKTALRPPLELFS